jgi:hypothetical protein
MKAINVAQSEHVIAAVVTEATDPGSAAGNDVPSDCSFPLPTNYKTQRRPPRVNDDRGLLCCSSTATGLS